MGNIYITMHNNAFFCHAVLYIVMLNNAFLSLHLGTLSSPGTLRSWNSTTADHKQRVWKHMGCVSINEC